MKFQQIATLIGVVGKKGNGTLDNGNQWSTDRVELHVLVDFPSSDSMCHGKTVTVFNLEDYAKNYEFAKSLLDQEVILHMELVSAKKLGMAPKMICHGLQSSKVTKPNNQSAVA